jgi:putative membrane protein
MGNRLSVLMIVLVLATSGAGAGPALDDATIFAIFDQANAVDIYTGRLGAKYGSSAEVRALGRMVASDHAAVQQMGRDLAKKLNIVPTLPDSDSSVANLARIVAQLQSKTGADFDKAYLQYEVAYHRSVVDAIKGSLLPAISNPELKTLMKAVLPGFERHLAATKLLASKMGL